MPKRDYTRQLALIAEADRLRRKFNELRGEDVPLFTRNKQTPLYALEAQVTLYRESSQMARRFAFNREECISAVRLREGFTRSREEIGAEFDRGLGR